MTESFEDAIKALRHVAYGNGNVLRIADRIVAAHERETKVEGVCGPITGELRAAMCQWGWVAEDGGVTFGNCAPSSIDAEKLLTISGSDFDRCCDAIDAVHAQLEREYEELRVKFVHANRHALHVERENESLKAELDRVLGEQEDRDGWIELPKDADGVPIRVGDVMVGEKMGGGYCEPFEVTGYVMSNGVIEPMDEHKMPRKAKYSHRHVTPDTWERIIEDALDGYHDTDFDALVARCKALAGDAE